MHKIRNKYFIRLAIFVVISIGSLLLFYNLYARDAFVNNYRKSIDELYNQIKMMNLAEPSSKDIKILDEYSARDISILIANEDTKVYSTHNSKKDIKKVKKIKERKSSKYLYDAIATIKKNEKVIRLKGKIQYEEIDYYVDIVVRLNALNSNIRLMNNILLTGLIIILIICVPFSFYMASKTLKPIEKLSKMTKQMGRNEYISKKEYHFAKDEIGELAEDIKDMYSKVSSSLNDVNNYNYLLKLQNRDLIKFEERRTEFINKATHELKTPLAIVSSQVEMLNIDNSQAMSEYYDSIMEEVQKMSDLIRNMLRTSFDDREVETVVLKEADLSEFIDNLKGKYAIWLDTQNIKSVFSVDKGIKIKMNERLIEQALNNYIINACEHVVSEGRIRITLLKKNNKAILSVYNDGEHISDEKIDKIWLQFVSDKKETDGSNVGLGLYIVKDIVEQHQGKCYVTNKPGGVEFSMEFDIV